MGVRPLSIGIDVGSTTVKAVLVDPATDEILWSDYQRHEGKQLAKVLDLMQQLETDFPEIKGPGIRAFARERRARDPRTARLALTLPAYAGAEIHQKDSSSPPKGWRAKPCWRHAS